jgi:polyhydroxyalkanoate synthesis regulator phasin
MFLTKKPITSSSLLEKKDRILNVFTVMQSELKQLHDEQKEYANNIQAKLKELSDELTLVETSRAETTKTINKIDNLLK